MQIYEKCKTCKYCFQHYGLLNEEFYPLDCGHCIRGENKLEFKKNCCYFEAYKRKNTEENVEEYSQKMLELVEFILERLREYSIKNARPKDLIKNSSKKIEK